MELVQYMTGREGAMEPWWKKVIGEKLAAEEAKRERARLVGKVVDGLILRFRISPSLQQAKHLVLPLKHPEARNSIQALQLWVDARAQGLQCPPEELLERLASELERIVQSNEC